MTRNHTAKRPRLAAAVILASLLLTPAVAPTIAPTAPPAVLAGTDIDAPDPDGFEIDDQPGGFEVDGTHT